MNRPEHPTDAAVRRLQLDSDERVHLLSDRDAKQALFQEITRMPVDLSEPTTSPIPRTRVPRRSLVLVATLASVSAGAVAGAVALFSSSSTSLGCHTPDGGVAIVDAVTGNPLTDCARIWEQMTGTEAPPLAAYDNGSGGIEVLPADEPAPDGWTSTDPGTIQDPSVIELEAALDDIADGLPAACRLLDDARVLATDELARLGLNGWSVGSDRGQADGTETCTYFYLDLGQRQVVLIPLEGVVAPPDAPYSVFARELADALDRDCLTVGQAAAAARDLAADAGLEAAGVVIYELTDDAAACTRTDVNVGGRVEVKLRGPAS